MCRRLKNSACSCLWPLRLHRLIPTLITSTSLWHSAGGVCSLLRNNWHSERECTTGICPWFPLLNGGRLHSSSLAGGGEGDVFPVTKHTSAPLHVCTTSFVLLMVDALDFPLDGTLTCDLWSKTASPCSRWTRREGLDCRNAWSWRL